MTDGEALLAAIRANPNEHTLRLVYADWLEENDQPELAEFIRLQVRYAELEYVTISSEDDSTLATCAELTHALHVLPGYLKIALDGGNAKFGIPERVCGIRVYVDETISPTGITSVDRIFSKLKEPPISDIRKRYQELYDKGFRFDPHPPQVWFPNEQDRT